MTRLTAVLLVLAFPATSRDATAGELGAFIGVANPWESWGGVLGAHYTATFFDLLGLEGEVARTRTELDGSSMHSFAVSALLSPPVGGLVPYGGLSFGMFRQTLLGSSDTGSIRAFVVGLKLRRRPIFAKVEYRRINLSGEPLLELDDRITVGAGVIF